MVMAEDKNELKLIQLAKLIASLKQDPRRYYGWGRVIHSQAAQ